MVNHHALLKRQSVFRVLLSLCLILISVNTVYSTPYAFTSDVSNVTPQTMQTADDNQGQWSNVSNLISGSGFTQNDDETQAQSKSTQTQQSATSSSSQSEKSNSAFVSEAQFLQLQQLVIQLNKTIIQLQQQTNNDISTLKQENASLSTRIKTLEIILRLLNHEIQTIKKVPTDQMQSDHSQTMLNDTSWFKTWYQKIYLFFMAQTMRFWIIVSVVVIVILLLFGFFSRPNSSAKTSVKKEDDSLQDEGEEGEYDFMNSKAAIPAKFDLANAYIQMGNVKDAVHILNDILKIGTEEEKQKAQTLLKKIQEQ